MYIEVRDLPKIEAAMRGELQTYEIQSLVKTLQATVARLNTQICKQSLQEVADAAKDGDAFYTPERAAESAMIILKQMVE